jgi:ribosomal protein L18
MYRLTVVKLTAEYYFQIVKLNKVGDQASTSSMEKLRTS